MTKKYLFLSGCPRSGTTALWDVIKEHSKIAMGLEKYNALIRNRSLEPRHFKEEVFFHKKFESRVFYNDTQEERKANYYNSLKERYNDCIFYGDKFPWLFRHYKWINKKFRKPKFIFILRNVFEVAESFQKRSISEVDNWPKERDYSAAILDWNNSIEKTLDFAKKNPNQILVINYENLFSLDFDLETVTKFLGLEMEASFLSNHKKLVIESQNIANQRKNVLSSSQLKDISCNANFSAYKELASFEP